MSASAIEKDPDPLPRATVTRLEPSPRDEAELVHRARSGDRWAQEELFRRHVGRVTATATRLLGDRVLAEDVAQDSFAIALERLPSLREPPAFGRWIVRIAVSQVHRIFRRRRIVRFLGFDAEPGALASLAAKTASPAQVAELELLDRALAELPAEQRTAWMLRHVEGMELREVADACDCSLATVKRRVAAAAARVRRHVEVGEP